MKVCIIGWYGTETIGDRGILAGIFSLLHKTVGPFSVNLGSLCPYFSERTISEDSSYYKKITGVDIPVSLFDSRVMPQLDSAVQQCDLLMVGGGPLMHINAMFMLEYAFKQARKKGKRTMLFGCGAGPLHKKRHQKAAVVLAENSDSVVMRDTASANHLQELYRKFGKTRNGSMVASSLDPSVQCLLDFQTLKNGTAQGDYIAVNLRSFPDEYAKGKTDVNELLFGFLRSLSEKFSDKLIRLIPMHYFHIGNDDRDFLNTLAIRLNRSNMQVQNVNLTLEQTMEVFQNAFLNAGMRFHSVVFQTVLSGKNIILDYTEPGKGKISGFLYDIGGDAFYKNRYVNLQSLSGAGGMNFPDVDLNGKFSFSKEEALKKLEVYQTALKSLFNI